MGKQVSDALDGPLVAVLERVADQILDDGQVFFQRFCDPSVGPRKGVVPGPIINGIDQRPGFGDHDGVDAIGRLQTLCRTQPFDVRLDKDEIGSADLLFSENPVIVNVNPVRDLVVEAMEVKGAWAADLVSAFVDLHEFREYVITADRPPSTGWHAGRDKIGAPFQTDNQTGGRHPVEEFPFLFGTNIQGGGNFARGDEFFFPELGVGKKLHFKFAQLGFFLFHYIARSFLGRGVTWKLVKYGAFVKCFFRI